MLNDALGKYIDFGECVILNKIVICCKIILSIILDSIGNTNISL